jgi:hypothetical protein
VGFHGGRRHRRRSPEEGKAGVGDAASLFGPCFTAKTQRAWVTGRAFGFFLQRAEAARLAMARNHQEDQLAAQRREAELRLATNQIENAKTTVAIQTAEEDARKVELRKKASEAAVQVKLAPFIQKGYWQIVGYSTEPKPLSFTALQSIGALDVSIKGMATLIRIATRQDDKVRSRWKLVGGSVYFQKYPESMEKVKEAQNLLIELGPVLVEMGMLQP